MVLAMWPIKTLIFYACDCFRFAAPFAHLFFSHWSSPMWLPQQRKGACSTFFLIYILSNSDHYCNTLKFTQFVISVFTYFFYASIHTHNDNKIFWISFSLNCIVNICNQERISSLQFTSECFIPIIWNH